MKYQLVILDFDGTLADSFPWFIRVFNEVADKFSFRKIRDHEIDTLRGLSGREMMKHLGVATWKVPLIVAHMRKLKTRDIDTIKLFPGVPEMMRGLKAAGIELAIVSSNAPHNVEKVLGANRALIDYLDCGGSIFGKASMLEKVLKQSATPADRALCIGDEIRDLEAAKSAGIPFGAVAWGYTNLPALQKHGPAEVFGTMGEIVAKLGG